MDQHEKQEKKMVNTAILISAGVGILVCGLLLVVVGLLAGYRVSADSAAGAAWRDESTYQMGEHTVYYTLDSEGVLDAFAMVEKEGRFYKKSSNGGRLLYPENSQQPAGILYSYRGEDCWHHVLLLNMVMPQGMSRTFDTLVARGVECPVAYSSCFTTTYSISELTIDGITLVAEERE